MCFSFSQGELFSHTVTAQHTSAKVEGLKPGTVYAVQIRARTVAGYGRYSSLVDFSTSLYGKDTYFYFFCICCKDTEWPSANHVNLRIGKDYNK